MYHPHKHGVLDHAFLSVFLRVGGKSGRAEGPTLILAVQTIRNEENTAFKSMKKHTTPGRHAAGSLQTLGSNH